MKSPYIKNRTLFIFLFKKKISPQGEETLNMLTCPPDKLKYT